jgi:hypothetical protein
MKIALRLRDPSPDWIALRKVIEDNATLRADVTLEVSEDNCRFLDAAGREISTDAVKVVHEKAVSDMDGKMRLLTMLHEKFSEQSPAV